MKKFDLSKGNRPVLRVFFGDDDDMPPRDPSSHDDRHSRNLQEEQPDTIWAGRVLANRLSARLAA